jgi:diguanylate cyclase (GGDEF)-like protein/PAS domain S-box-containing protein
MAGSAAVEALPAPTSTPSVAVTPVAGGRDRAARRLRVVRQVVPVLVLAVVVGAVFGVVVLRRRADDGRGAELRLARLEAAAYEAASSSSSVPVSMSSRWVEFDHALADAVSGLHGRPADVRSLRGVAAAFRASEGGDAGRLLDEVGRLSSAQAARAGRLRWVSDVGSLLLLFVAGCIVWLLLRQADRAKATAASEQRFRSLVQNSSDMITVVDTDGRVLFETPSVTQVLGYQPGDLLGTDINRIVHPDDAASVHDSFVRVVREHMTTARVECRVLHADGAWRHVETAVSAQFDGGGVVVGWVLNTRDITERKELESQLTHQAFHDSLTGLANRALFRNRIEHALHRQRRQRQPLAVLLFDLDGFKTINDSLGHAFGDALLASVSDRLSALLRPSDTACRLGGDEFAVLVEDLVDVLDATVVAGRLLEGLAAPFVVDGKEVVVGASVGIALCPPLAPATSFTPDDLLRNADVAMYTAKARGRGRCEVFKPSMHQAMLDRLDLEADLRRAVERGEFVLHYQPTVALASGRISGMEALVRWESSSRGAIVPPGLFIPVCEDTGLIVPLGAWVLEEACRQAVAWKREFGADAPSTISVNVSARQLQDDELVPSFAAILASTGINPTNVILEITESAIMTDAEAMVARLHELKALGVRLAIDDFGTGYSSMSYLCSFPIDILKIDRSFVSGVEREPQKIGIVRTIVELGRILDLQTVAEGIELDAELEQLRALDCDLGQGYRFARPLTTSAMYDLLSDQAAARRRGELAVLPAPSSAATAASA